MAGRGADLQNANPSNVAEKNGRDGGSINSLLKLPFLVVGIITWTEDLRWVGWVDTYV